MTVRNLLICMGTFKICKNHLKFKHYLKYLSTITYWEYCKHMIKPNLHILSHFKNFVIKT